MRITDLLDVKSISLNQAPKSKQEALDMAIALMVKSGKIRDKETWYMQEKRRVQQELVMELLSRTEKVMRWRDRDLRPWLSGMEQNLTLWTESR